jgi:hypothetical protein
MNRKIALRAAVGASAMALAVFSTAYAADATTAEPKDTGALAKMSHSAAAKKLGDAGIGVRSSGGCSDRNNSSCTSLDQVNSETVDGAVTLKGASKCDMTVTGGTETGHASGQFSHWNGFKLDFAMNNCLTSYVKNTFTSIGGNKWKSGSGNIYFDEGNHWDVTFHNCGGCLSGDKG